MATRIKVGETIPDYWYRIRSEVYTMCEKREITTMLSFLCGAYTENHPLKIIFCLKGDAALTSKESNLLEERFGKESVQIDLYIEKMEE
jgi:hypothetical protein